MSTIPATHASDLHVGDTVRRTNGIGGTGVVVSVYTGPDYDAYATVRMEDGEWSGTDYAWTRVASVGDTETADDATDTERGPVDDRFDAHVGVYGGAVTRERYATYVAWEAECHVMKLHGFGTPEHRAAHDRVTALWVTLMYLSGARSPFAG